MKRLALPALLLVLLGASLFPLSFSQLNSYTTSYIVNYNQTSLPSSVFPGATERVITCSSFTGSTTGVCSYQNSSNILGWYSYDTNTGFINSNISTVSTTSGVLNIGSFATSSNYVQLSAFFGQTFQYTGGPTITIPNMSSSFNTAIGVYSNTNISTPSYTNYIYSSTSGGAYPISHFYNPHSNTMCTSGDYFGSLVFQGQTSNTNMSTPRNFLQTGYTGCMSLDTGNFNFATQFPYAVPTDGKDFIGGGYWRSATEAVLAGGGSGIYTVSNINTTIGSGSGFSAVRVPVIMNYISSNNTYTHPFWYLNSTRESYFYETTGCPGNTICGGGILNTGGSSAANAYWHKHSGATNQTISQFIPTGYKSYVVNFSNDLSTLNWMHGTQNAKLGRIISGTNTILYVYNLDGNAATVTPLLNGSGSCSFTSSSNKKLGLVFSDSNGNIQQCKEVDASSSEAFAKWGTDGAAGKGAMASEIQSFDGSVTNGDDFIIGGYFKTSASIDGQSISTSQTAGQPFLMRLNAGALPVELVGFDAVFDQEIVKLIWQTATETNNAGFEIQHKLKAEPSFAALGFVDGFGTTLEAQTYEHRISDLEPGRHVFRLKQIDFDGSFSFSPEVELTIELPDAFELSEAYPNPFNTQTTFTLTLQASQEVTIDVYNTLGQRAFRLHEGLLEAGPRHTFTIDASPLSSGMYVYDVRGETFAESRSVLVIK